ncbi:hypothetical protein [uncultured Draconibacterium sp.]|uniref:hypothetical protein n=1 Tax=uncultured Draconibacterium sp. TaxID=1573823 RepID=UPI0029C8F826|nr:hypothetical protein [uncultured Draconibacterium sp.]
MKKNYTNKQMSFLRMLSVVMCLMLIVPAMAKAQGKTNFAGNWAFNESKSKLGDSGRRFGGGDFVVKQEANLLSVERSFNDQSFTSKYTLDGKESVNSFGRGESKSTAKWSDDGKSLTIVTKMNFNDMEIKSTQVWTLNDAKTLSIVSTRPNRDGGTVTTTSVYDKK